MNCIQFFVTYLFLDNFCGCLRGGWVSELEAFPSLILKLTLRSSDPGAGTIIEFAFLLPSATLSGDPFLSILHICVLEVFPETTCLQNYMLCISTSGSEYSGVVLIKGRPDNSAKICLFWN